LRQEKSFQKQLKKWIKEMILVLTDLFGGSPSNIAFSFLNKEKMEVITGVNLPMILNFWNKRKSRGLMRGSRQ
jgi:PTS system mannose-specific IIA component